MLWVVVGVTRLGERLPGEISTACPNQAQWVQRKGAAQIEIASTSVREAQETVRE